MNSVVLPPSILARHLPDGSIVVKVVRGSKILGVHTSKDPAYINNILVARYDVKTRVSRYMVKSPKWVAV